MNVLLIAAIAVMTPPAARIDVVVDPRVELMSIVFRLAGNDEYNQVNSKSPYADQVEARFGPHRDHAAVQTARRLRRQYGVSYDAVMSMAVHLADTDTLAEYVPFDPHPERLDSRWQLVESKLFLGQTRDFARETDFNGFVAEHRDFYAAAAARLREPVEARAYVDWFDEFFGERQGARFTAIVGLLNGGGSYGVGVRFEDGREEITPVIGAYRFDKEGLPIFDSGVEGTIVHELCHSYTNPIVDAFTDELEPAGKAIYPHRAAVMRRQAYGNWKTMMYESMVRACVVRFTLANDGEDAARERAEYEVSRGFTWTFGLSKLLGEFETSRQEYPTLNDFMPRVVRFFDEIAERVGVKAADTPTIVSMNPRNGATDVDPDRTVITVVFDRAMADRSWSVVGGGPDYPETTGPPSYDVDRRVFTLPVRLEPGRTYHFGLNSATYTAFKSAEGVPLEPVEVTFTTRAR